MGKIFIKQTTPGTKIFAIIFGNSKDKKGGSFSSIGDDRSVPAGSPFADTGDTLLNQATTKVRINQAFIGASNGFTKLVVTNTFFACKPDKPFVLEYTPNSLI